LLKDFEKKYESANRSLDVVLTIGRAGPLAEAQEAVIDGTAAITIFPYDFFGALGLLATSSSTTAKLLLDTGLLGRLVADLKKAILRLRDKSNFVDQPLTGQTQAQTPATATATAAAQTPQPIPTGSTTPTQPSTTASSQELSGKEAQKESSAQFQAIRFLEGSLDFLASVAHDSLIKTWLGTDLTLLPPSSPGSPFCLSDANYLF